MNYSTSFPLTEDPISEGSAWINGSSVGLDWSDCQTFSGSAAGTTTNPSSPPPYNDSTAVLIGTWATNQTARGKLKKTNGVGGAGSDNEVELRLNSSVSAHVCNGYEFDFGLGDSGADLFIAIVRWNGAVNDFTVLVNNTPSSFNDGDILTATNVGGLLTAYVNDAVIAQVTDNTFVSGSPGMGFWNGNGLSPYSDYGFYNFSASDGSGSQAYMEDSYVLTKVRGW